MGGRRPADSAKLVTSPMNVRLPLSLKVSLWLSLNLLLIAGAAAVWFFLQADERLGGLVAGPVGARAQVLADTLAAELWRTEPAARDDLLARRGTEQGATFAWFDNDGRQLAGVPVDLPPALASFGLRHIPRGPLAGRPGRGGPRPDLRRPPGPFLDDREGERPGGPGFLPDRQFARTTAPAAYWLSLRARFSHEAVDSPRPVPTVIVIRLDSFWALAGLLGLRQLLWVAVVVMGVSILFWLPFVRSITRAVHRLDEATDRIAGGDFATRVGLERRDELGRLGGSVDRMAGRLETLVNGQKRFLGDVAHELCSPLARLELATSILRERADPALHPAVADVAEEVRVMSQLVDELLAFTKAGLRRPDAAPAAVELAPLAGEVAARENAAGRLAVSVPDGLRVLADRDLLARALGNLLRNAVRYAPAGAITLAAQPDGAAVRLTLADEGPGVPLESLPRLGEPFYRPGTARTRESGGTGLGLAIVRACIDACRGTVEFRNRSPRGFEVVVRLPAAPADFTQP